MSNLRRTLLAALLVMGSPAVIAASMPAAVHVAGPGVTGTVVRYAGMPSTHVAPRNVDVWLPPGYARNPAQRYPVLYMHDGQNLFDPATSYGNVDWAVDEVMTDLIAKGAVREAIVVGIWNTSKRRDEYMPQRPVRGKIKFNVPGAEDLDAADIVSDHYLEFMVKELKPFIDATYRTLPGRADHFIDVLELRFHACRARVKGQPPITPGYRGESEAGHNLEFSPFDQRMHIGT